MIGSHDNTKVSCDSCICKFNRMLGEDFPCNCCERFSEYVPIDEETYQEGFWLDDPEIVNSVLNAIDEVNERLQALDFFLTGLRVTENTADTVAYLSCLKKTIISLYMAHPDNESATGCKELPW